MADPGKWRLPAENLAPGHAGWGLWRKGRAAFGLSARGWPGAQVPSLLLISIILSQMRGVVPATLRLPLIWDLFLHPGAGVALSAD